MYSQQTGEVPQKPASGKLASSHDPLPRKWASGSSRSSVRGGSGDCGRVVGEQEPLQLLSQNLPFRLATRRATFGDAPLCSLPEILCLWAREPLDLWGQGISHLAERIRGGNWASGRMQGALPN
jgi:hypothetical protein